MKQKLTLLILALVTTMGAWADATFTVDTSNPLTSVSQIKTNESYVLYNMGRRKYMNVDVSENKIKLTATLPSTTAELLPFIIRFEENTSAKSDGGAYQIKFYNGTYMDWTTPVRTRNDMGSIGYVPTYDTNHFYFTTWGNNAAKTSAQYINGNENYVVFYGNITDGDNSNYAIYKVTPGLEEAVTVGSSTGTYYDTKGQEVTTWGSTWKSTVTNGGSTPLLTLDASAEMNAAENEGDMYATTGNGHTYTLTAADGYVITGYTLNGTATNSNITIHPQLRNNTTVTNGESLGTAMSVSGLDLNSLTFTLISSNATGDYLDNPTLKVSLAYTGTMNYTPPVADGTLGQIGYKHIGTGADRYMTYIKENGGGALSATQVSTTLADAPASAGTYKLEYNSSERTYYIKEVVSGQYLRAKDVAMSNISQQSSNSAAMEVATLPATGDKSLFQWTLQSGGTYCGSMSYYIRPKLNVNTAIAVQYQDAGILSFYDNERPYDFAHAFIREKTWEDVTTAYLEANPTIEQNVSKAGKVGYPKAASEYAAALTGLFTAFKSGSYNETLFNNLKSWYPSYLSTAWADIEKPTTGKFYRFKAAKSGKYLKGEESTTKSTESSGYHLLNTANEEGAKSIFYFEDNPSGNDYLLGYSTGRYIIYTSHLAPAGTSEKSMFEFEAPYSYFGALSVKANATSGGWGRYLYSHTDEKDYANQQGSKADETDWYIEEIASLPVTLTDVGGHGFASFYTPAAISELPEGVKAYTASVEGVRIKFESIDDIPAGTGVILYQPSYSSDPVNLTIGDASSTITTNILRGRVATTPLATVKTELGATDILTMQNPENLGFYKFNGTNLTGFKAFVRSNDAPSVKSFVLDFDDIEDGIRSLFEETEEEAIYNLAGQRLNKMQKGINIVNGKKVLK